MYSTSLFVCIVNTTTNQEIGNSKPNRVKDAQLDVKSRHRLCLLNDWEPEPLVVKMATHTEPASQLYTKLNRVGKGAYGSVYKGYARQCHSQMSSQTTYAFKYSINNKTRQIVAIKILNLDTEEDDVDDIQKEIALLSQLTHAKSQNITPYYGSVLNDTKLWIIMDYAAGGSVRRIVSRDLIDTKSS